MLKNKPKGPHYFIISEICEKGELFDFVEDAGGLPEKYARTCFKQIISALVYIHKKKLAHRDMKLENVFLNKNTVSKVADFGLMKSTEYKMQTLCGTQNYMAPELFGKVGTTYEGSAVDVFACGVMLFMILTAKQPFHKAKDNWYKAFMGDP